MRQTLSDTNKPKPVLVQLDDNLLGRVDTFRFANRFVDRSKAIRWLLDYALSQKPRVSVDTTK